MKEIGDIFFAIGAFAIGALVGFVFGAPPPQSSEWERWFRYYLDALGHTTIERSAALADAAMEEITKRRKG